MEQQNWFDYVLAIVRHILSYAGGILVTKGIATSSQEEAIIGGILGVIAIVASLIQKKKAQKQVTALTKA